MKELLIENMELIFTLITMLVTYVFGKIAKKSKVVEDRKIPLQNITVAICMGFVYYLATGDISIVVASGSPIMTLLYDAVHNLKKEE